MNKDDLPPGRLLARQPCYALNDDFCEVVEDFARYGDLAPGMLKLLRELAELNEALRNGVDCDFTRARGLLEALR